MRDDAWIAGRTLAEARLRTRTGATLVAVSRGEATAVHPAPDDVLQAGDLLCLVGDERQVGAACALLEAGPLMTGFRARAVAALYVDDAAFWLTRAFAFR